MNYRSFRNNPVFFGSFFGVLVIVVNIGIASLAEGSLQKGIDVYSANGFFIILVPVSVAVFMALFRAHRNLPTSANSVTSEKIGMGGSVTSSGAMVLCCLHHVTELLPTVGFLVATTSFLTDFKDVFIVLGLMINTLASLYLLSLISKDSKLIGRSHESCEPGHT